MKDGGRQIRKLVYVEGERWQKKNRRLGEGKVKDGGRKIED